MHLMQNSKLWPKNCGLALRCIASQESVREDSLLDALGPVLESAELTYQLEAMEQTLRFLNNAEDFQARELHVLLRSMQLTRLQDRLPWWQDVRACRRRSAKPWHRLSLSQVFTQQDEFIDWATKALLLRVRWALAAQKMWPGDAFRIMDTSCAGVLRFNDLKVGLEKFGVNCKDWSPDRWEIQVRRLFQLLDKEGKEVVLPEDWSSAMELEVEIGPDVFARGGDSEDASAVEKIIGIGMGKIVQSLAPRILGAGSEASPPSPPDDTLNNRSARRRDNSNAGFSGLATMATAAASTWFSHHLEQEEPSKLTPEMCKKLSAGRFKMKWQKHSSFRPVWTTSKSSTESPISIWAAGEIVPRGMFLGMKKGSNAVKERIPMGHFVSGNFAAPSGIELLEVTDTQHSGFFAKHPRDELAHFLEVFFPRPLRYEPLWCLKDGKHLKPVYVWQPIPPSRDYIAAGVVCTADEEVPAVDEMRCVPRLWAETLDGKHAKQVWSGAGSDGLAASFWAYEKQSGGNADASLVHVSAGATAKDPPRGFSMPASGKKFYAVIPGGTSTPSSSGDSPKSSSASSKS
eukprot:TRINITY_DN99929_c0_g1_i1.p1 TRINITY_DN99929_c0_g1~~TRINITY_DN99929_c0_g1_i1.p1  ORF type:complete len:573 (-),score=106.86 TRINITY_DN99929_c0_g1_i1:209-1927(-)